MIPPDRDDVRPDAGKAVILAAMLFFTNTVAFCIRSLKRYLYAPKRIVWRHSIGVLLDSYK